MKVFLMHQDRDFDLQRRAARTRGELTQDLHLTTLFDAMAGDDRFLYGRGGAGRVGEPARRRGNLLSPAGPDDCLRQRAWSGSSMRSRSRRSSARRRPGGCSTNSPDTILHHSLQVLELFVGILKRLRAIADSQAGELPVGGVRAVLRDAGNRARRRVLPDRRGPPPGAEGSAVVCCSAPSSARATRASAMSCGVAPALSWRERLWPRNPLRLRLHDPGPRRERVQGLGLSCGDRGGAPAQASCRRAYLLPR